MSEVALCSDISMMSLEKDQRLRLVVQSPYTFTETHVATIEERLVKISEGTRTECKYLPSKETVRIFADTREDLEAARVEVTALLRDQGRVICGKGDNLCRKYIQVKQKSKRKSKRNEKEENMVSPFPVDQSDDEGTVNPLNPPQEPELTSSVLFHLDRRVRNFSDLFNNYGVEHLPPVVPGAVDRLRDIQNETGVQCTIQGRNLMITSPNPAALEDAVARIVTLQYVHLNPPPVDPKPDIIIHHDDINMNFLVGIRPIASTRTSNSFSPLPYELRNAYDLLGLDYRPEDPSRKRNWDRRSSVTSETSTSSEPKSKEYASVTKETLVPRPVPVYELPGIVRKRKNLSILVNSLTYGLEHARRWRGEVTLEAKLGSIAVVEPSNVQLNEKLDFDQVQDIFSGKHPQLRFSDVVTTNQSMSEEMLGILISVGEVSCPPSPSPMHSYANPSGFNSPNVPTTPVSASKPSSSVIRNRTSHFVITCRARADVNHPWTQAKITLEAGTLKLLSVVPRASTPLADVFWKNLERSWDYRIRLKGRYPPGRGDVKPFITFLKKVTFSPQGAGISYHDQPGLFEVIGLKHKLMVSTPLDATNYQEVVISRVTIMPLASEARVVNGPSDRFFSRPERTVLVDAFRKNGDAEDRRTEAGKPQNRKDDISHLLSTADSDDSDNEIEFTTRDDKGKQKDFLEDVKVEFIEAANKITEDETANKKEDGKAEGGNAANEKTDGDAGGDGNKANEVVEKSPCRTDKEVGHLEVKTKTASCAVDKEAGLTESEHEVLRRIDDDDDDDAFPETETESTPIEIDDNVAHPEEETPELRDDSREVDRNGVPRIHYTIKIRNNRWRKRFEENRTMGVGKTAGWTVEGILNKPVMNATPTTPTNWATRTAGAATPSPGAAAAPTWNPVPMNPNATPFVLERRVAPKPNPNGDLVDFVRSVITVGEQLHHLSKKYAKMGEAAITASIPTVRTIRIVSVSPESTENK